MDRAGMGEEPLGAADCPEALTAGPGAVPATES